MEKVSREACMRGGCWERDNTAWDICSLIHLHCSPATQIPVPPHRGLPSIDMGIGSFSPGAQGSQNSPVIRKHEALEATERRER